MVYDGEVAHVTAEAGKAPGAVWGPVMLFLKAVCYQTYIHKLSGEGSSIERDHVVYRDWAKMLILFILENK